MIAFLTLFLLIFSFIYPTLAQVEPTVEDPPSDADVGLKQEVDTLQDQVKQKQTRVKELDAMIKGYRDKQVEQQAAALSLQNQLALLENGIQEKQLSVERAQREAEATTLEIQALATQITLQQNAITKREAALTDIFGKLQQDSSISIFDAFLSRPSLSELFVRVDELARLEGDLGEATRVLKSEKTILEGKRKQQEVRRAALEQQKLDAQVAQTELEEERSSKLSLINATQDKEDEFRKIVYELRQQQQSEAGDIQSLQDRLKDRLDSIDAALARGDVLLNWPVPVKRGVSAHFHDPTYPFRKLFEHPGVDLPTPVGTPVRAAAGGYVAWNRTGKQYGNYVMVVHAGGVATVYAHLSKFGSKPDTYVERGDIIGYSGGKPGDPGAGLSTGPHLHFEVRQNGIPVNPENFLPDLD
ncbi:peptidoglycan DD-metalloendopeptidase family protein [Patescibacteria group bacterium]|nr:peptidoglycan DD-metalloendopeptidase family protein [Patescibacteria group bacterium]